MDLALRDKWALVTGSSAGIGEVIAYTLSREGAKVIVHGRDIRRTEAVASAIRVAGGTATTTAGDLASDEGAARVASEALVASGGIDILINNAGGYAARFWSETTTDTWRSFYEADVLSAIRMIQALVPGMRERKWGRIINIGTGLTATPGDALADYSAAKAALLNATVSLSKALAGTGITVNSVSPGLIHTAGVEDVLKKHAIEAGWSSEWMVIQRNWFEHVLANRTVDRLGTPQEVADLVAFVSSPRAGYINGANLRIDGGLTPSVN
jgi:NAD(P)-dependent dehydrogenase (short-subunit alcohol dehydrogenase family)